MADIFKHRKIGVRCYDNGGKTADRYTVIFSGRYKRTCRESLYLSMSGDPFHPMGIGAHCESDCPVDNRGYGQKGGYSHLGKKVSFDDLPEPCRRLVMLDVFDLALM